MYRHFLQFEKLVTRHFSLFLIASVVIGLLFPALAEATAPWIMPTLMLVIYLGFLKTDYQVLGREALSLKRQIWLTFYGLVLIPSLLFLAVKGLGQVIDIHPAWSTGVLLLFACPVAALAPTLSLVMHGHFERTLCSLIVTSFLAPFTLPLLLSFWVGAEVEVSIWDMMLFLMKLILVPFAAAQITRRFFKPLQSALKPHTACLSVLLLAAVVVGAVAGLTDTVTGNPRRVLEGVLISSACMFLAYSLGWLAHPAGASKADRSTLAILSTWTNIGLSIVFAKQFFPGSDILLFVVLSEIPWNLSFAPAHAFTRRRFSATTPG